MKNLVKMSLMALVVVISLNSCKEGGKVPQNKPDTGNTDSVKPDASAVKPDTTKGDTIKKK